MQRSSALKAAAVWWRPLQAIDIDVTQETLTIAIVKPFSSSSSLFFLKLPRRLEEEEEARHCSALLPLDFLCNLRGQTEGDVITERLVTPAERFSSSVATVVDRWAQIRG